MQDDRQARYITQVKQVQHHIATHIQQVARAFSQQVQTHAHTMVLVPTTLDQGPMAPELILRRRCGPLHWNAIKDPTGDQDIQEFWTHAKFQWQRQQQDATTWLEHR